MPSNFFNTEAPLLLALAACPVSKLPFLTIDTLLHPVPSHAIPHPRSSCFGITIHRAIPYHVTQTESSTIFNIFFPCAACFLCLQRWSKLHSWRRWARSTSKTKTLQAEPNLPIPFKYVGWNVSFQTNQLEFVEVCHRFVFPGCKLPLVKIFISCIWAFFRTRHTYTWQRKQSPAATSAKPL